MVQERRYAIFYHLIPIQLLTLGVSEPEGSVRDNMLYLSGSYQHVCKERQILIDAYEQYIEFLATFKDKAIHDALVTMKKQHTSRLQLDAYGSKLGQLEEKKLKYLVIN